jgi:plasmid stabilization system protein ParE
MVEVRWTHQACEDLQAIVEFIAKDSSHYARLFVVDIFQATERIAMFPKSGRIVPELGNPVVRELILGNYRLAYRLKVSCVELLTVYHGARLLDPDKLK